MQQPVFELFTGLASDFDSRYQSDPNFIERWQCWTSFIDRYLEPGDIVYDLGCGPGVFSFYAASKGGVVTGIDGSAGMIARCNEKLAKMQSQASPRLRFLQDTLPLEKAGALPRAGLIICSSLFEYIPDQRKMTECFHNLLREGGVLLLSVPNRESVYRSIERLSYSLVGKPAYLRHVHHMWSKKELEREMGDFGFRLLEQMYFASHYTFSGLLKAFLPPRKYNNLLLAAFRKAN